MWDLIFILAGNVALSRHVWLRHQKNMVVQNGPNTDWERKPTWDLNSEIGHCTDTGRKLDVSLFFYNIWRVFLVTNDDFRTQDLSYKWLQTQYWNYSIIWYSYY